jgi:hypothetical protein
MIGADLVVAVRHEDDAACRFDAASDETEGVQSRFVGRVRILDHHHSEQRKLAEDCGEQLVACRTALHKPCGCFHVEKRPEWPGSRQRIARAPQKPRRFRSTLHEHSRKARLPDTGLAAGECQSS